MKVIYKYPLEVTDDQFINIPKDYQILTVQVQNGRPCLWAEVDPKLPMDCVHIVIVGTGHSIHDDDEMKYIGTFQLESGSFVGHCFISK